eukprot:scaffold46380_cov22-Prasinocladus_malaysianus.AAC.1
MLHLLRTTTDDRFAKWHDDVLLCCIDGLTMDTSTVACVDDDSLHNCLVTPYICPYSHTVYSPPTSEGDHESFNLGPVLMMIPHV